MKYKVGDIVKLRDDLEDGKKYGTVRYAREMDFIKGKPMELIAKSNALKNCYITKDEEYAEWYLTDEMIEGLWEECKGITYEPYEEKTNKLKLIDVLNMIANGELKEDYRTEIKMNGLYYKLFACETADKLLPELFIHLNDECELIEPNDFADDGKMVELKELDSYYFSMHDATTKCWDLYHKLNEVIRYINK